mmetsp:Transcript_17225/g.19934  ORF Transcript_17225/g.19934 Transcript_17225/m.19934 type:complete len:365 (-) Transcript_17225:37-1131(-)
MASKQRTLDLDALESMYDTPASKRVNIKSEISLTLSEIHGVEPPNFKHYTGSRVINETRTAPPPKYGSSNPSARSYGSDRQRGLERKKNRTSQNRDKRSSRNTDHQKVRQHNSKNKPKTRNTDGLKHKTQHQKLQRRSKNRPRSKNRDMNSRRSQNRSYAQGVVSNKSRRSKQRLDDKGKNNNWPSTETKGGNGVSEVKSLQNSSNQERNEEAISMDVVNKPIVVTYITDHTSSGINELDLSFNEQEELQEKGFVETLQDPAFSLESNATKYHRNTKSTDALEKKRPKYSYSVRDTATSAQRLSKSLARKLSVVQETFNIPNLTAVPYEDLSHEIDDICQQFELDLTSHSIVCKNCGESKMRHL